MTQQRQSNPRAVHGLPPCLKAGNGLPARVVVLCDGRTSLRVSQELNGFDNLVHYEHDSWFQFSKVLSHDGLAMRWQVDGAPHRFDWTQVYPFGYENREERAAAGILGSRCLVVQNSILWSFSGVGKSAVFSIPKAMFKVGNDTDAQGAARDVSAWSFPGVNAQPVKSWCAVRKESWRLRDSSTYAGIAGKTIASENHTSALHLCLMASRPLRVRKSDEQWEFEIPASAHGTLALVVGLGDSAAAARAHAELMLTNATGQWQAQVDRYAAIAAEIPRLDFGRHTALRQLFQLQPGYLESMRIREQPGAYRANNDYYWVWGWDMTRPAFGILTSNRHLFVRNLLDFVNDANYCNQYDNSLTRDLRADGGQPGALEFMLAHDYLAWTGDLAATLAWRAKFEAALTQEAANPDPTGMWPGAAASTDFPEEFGRTFPAWLAYTTSWHYAGLLCAEKLLQAWGNPTLAEKIRGQALKIRRNFQRVFWNPKTGFWNEGVHPSNPDLVCDIPLSTAVAAMDSPYGEDLYGDKLQATADYCAAEFIRDDGVSIVCRDETRGWKEWTRQPRNWFAANDTMLVRLMRSTGNIKALDKLFYLYEINFGYQPCVFEGKSLHRPLFTSGSWQAFGAGAWYRNLVEGAAGLWADLGGLGFMPAGLGEPVRLTGLKYRTAMIDFHAQGQGLWPVKVLVDGKPLCGVTKFPPFTRGRHHIEVEYGAATPEHPLLTLAVDAEVRDPQIAGSTLRVSLRGNGYTPLAFFSPGTPRVRVGEDEIPCEWDARTGRGRTRLVLKEQAVVTIESRE